MTREWSIENLIDKSEAKLASHANLSHFHLLFKSRLKSKFYIALQFSYSYIEQLKDKVPFEIVKRRAVWVWGRSVGWHVEILLLAFSFVSLLLSSCLLVRPFGWTPAPTQVYSKSRAFSKEKKTRIADHSRFEKKSSLSRPGLTG